MENFVFPDICSFMLIAMTKSLNKSTVDQQTLQSLWGCLGDNHWAQSVLRSLSMDRQIKTDQIFHIWDNRLGPKASFIKGVERGISNIANYSIVRYWDGTAHLSKGPSDLKQNRTQGKTQFSGKGCHALPRGVVNIVPICCSSRNHILNCQTSSAAHEKPQDLFNPYLKSTNHTSHFSR